MEFPLKSAVAAIALASATPAFALDVFSPCDPTRPSPDATACSGYFEDNLLGGGPKIDLQNEGLDMLVGGDFTDIDWTAVEGTKTFFSINDEILTFDAALLGMLNSCANGVSVVNIDNGYGAGCIASMINHL